MTQYIVRDVWSDVRCILCALRIARAKAEATRMAERKAGLERI